MDNVTSWPLVMPFTALDRSALQLAGGKGANLGELVRGGFPVPIGFCITTAAYAQVAINAELEQILSALDDAFSLSLEQLSALAEDAREALLATPVPDAVRTAILMAYAGLSDSIADTAVAVRSSATAEDLPGTSFSGQHDTFLNVIGSDAVLNAVRRCWASLWTDRAMIYRITNGFDHRAVKMAVVIQKMVPASVSGVLFTANPLTNRRQEAVIDAVPGLGEALVQRPFNVLRYFKVSLDSQP